MRIARRFFVKLAGAIGGAALGIRAAPWIAEPRRYRACVIGSTGRGGYGHGLDVAFQRIPRVSVVAVADPDEKGRREAARRAGAERTYADWREMLEKERPDLVSIGPRWAVDRLEMVRAAAEVGAHVYMEKPIAQDLEEADAIVDTAEKRGIRIAVAHQVREAPGTIYLKRRIDEGLIGEVLELRTRGKEDHRAGGEDLMVLGTHCMYLMRYFAGPALWCSARVTQDGREITARDGREATEPLGPVAGDSIHATYAFSGGVQGHFASQKGRRGGQDCFQLSIHGSKGIALMHIDQEPEIYWLPDPTWSPGKTKVVWRPLEGLPSSADPTGLRDEEAANKRAVEGLIRWIETGEESPVSIREARAALEMIMAVYVSQLSGARAALPLAQRKHPLRGA